MSDPRLKQIKIKAGVVKRCTKDVTSYIKEAELQEVKIQKWKTDSSKDEHDIRKQEEVLVESLMMIPDSKRR